MKVSAVESPDAQQGASKRTCKVRRVLTTGSKVILCLLALEYIGPAVGYMLCGDTSEYEWPNERLDIWLYWAACILMVALPAVLVGQLTVQSRQKQVATHRPMRLVSLVCIGTALVLCVTKFFVESNWRYNGVNISSHESTAEVAILVANDIAQSLVPLITWWIILFHRDLVSRRMGGNVLCQLAFATALVLSINGVGSALNAAFGFAMLVTPALFTSLVFIMPKNKSPRLSLRVLANLMLAAALGILLIQLGLQSKTQSNSVEEFLSSWETHTNPAYLLGRFGTHQVISMAAIQTSIDASIRQNDLTPWETAKNGILYRASLLGLATSTVERPELTSISQYTQRKYARYDSRTTEGCSPGFIGEIITLTPPPFSLLVIAAVTAITIFVLNRLFSITDPLSWLGCLLFAFAPLRSFTDTPIEVVFPLNSSMIQLSLFSIIFLAEWRARLPRRIAS